MRECWREKWILERQVDESVDVTFGSEWCVSLTPRYAVTYVQSKVSGISDSPVIPPNSWLIVALFGLIHVTNEKTDRPCLSKGERDRQQLM